MFVNNSNRKNQYFCKSLKGMNSASLCSLAGRYDIPIPPRFLAPVDSIKIPAQIVQVGQEQVQ
jgi:hypothetical protein